MNSSEDDARAEALESARRVYDRQVATLENIDDKAMRTTRTAVLVLGFIAAALTAGGPDAVSNLNLIPVLFGGAGTLTVFLSAFLGIGIYTVTEYPVEIRESDLRAANRVSREEWVDGTLAHLQQTSAAISREISQNTRYLEVSQLLLMSGSSFLLLGAGTAVINQSYDVLPRIQLAVFVVAAGIALGLAKLMSSRL